MIAFIFPGQGSQKVGMGRELYEAYPEARAAFDEADAALAGDGPSLSRVIFEGPEADLTLTENAQPAILTVSIAANRVLAARGIAPQFVAGHSLGEYSANVAAGTMAFADAVRIDLEEHLDCLHDRHPAIEVEAIPMEACLEHDGLLLTTGSHLSGCRAVPPRSAPLDGGILSLR